MWRQSDLRGCTLCGLLHRCTSQKQYQRGENKRVVCYVSVSLVLLPVMHNECLRQALSIESKYKPTRVSLTWLPELGPNSMYEKSIHAIVIPTAWIKAIKRTNGKSFDIQKHQDFFCIA